MTIVLTGGGSGGHITPILAVASELKKLHPEVRLVYVGQTGDSLADIPRQHSAIDEVYTVRAGKLRRYHGEGWRQLFDLHTQAKNLRDACFVIVGIWQSFWLMRRLRPSIIFSRGGFVSVPVCIGGKLNGVPYITHDSDSLPSLANRLIAPWAIMNAVALPEELYPYQREKTRMVGVPVSEEYVPVSTNLQHKYREELGLNSYKYVVLVTGGGNGADQLNKAAAKNAKWLLDHYPDLVIVHIAGRSLENSLARLYDELIVGDARERVHIKGFVSDLYRYSGAADVVVARGGATNLAEFALQHKACIIVPAPHLVGGHQVKNAQAMADRRAIIMLTEDQSNQDGKLADLISNLLRSPEQRATLGRELSKFGRSDAARELAMILLEKIGPAKR